MKAMDVNSGVGLMRKTVPDPPCLLLFLLPHTLDSLLAQSCCGACKALTPLLEVCLLKWQDHSRCVSVSIASNL